MAERRVMARFGGAGILPSGAYHLESPTTVPDREHNASNLLSRFALTRWAGDCSKVALLQSDWSRATLLQSVPPRRPPPGHGRDRAAAATRPVVVVGDALLDVDVEGTVDRLCPDAPAPVLAVTGELARPGGAGLTAALVAGRGVPVRLVTALEADEAGERLRGLLDGALTLVAGPATGGTVVKCRWRAGGRSLLRTDRGAGRPASGFGAAIADALDAALVRRRRGARVGLRPRGRGGPGRARRARPGRGPPGAGGVGPAPARRAAGRRASRS